MNSGEERVALTLRVNGHVRSTYVRPADTLLRVLRAHFGLTGAKPGCENGDCGACTVHLDGEAFKACLMLAVEAAGCSVTTIEGLNGTPIQHAFIEQQAFQCGYCTSGFIMNAEALVNARPDASDEEIEEWLQSNICRCTSYQEISNAVKSVLRGETAVQPLSTDNRSPVTGNPPTAAPHHGKE